MDGRALAEGDADTVTKSQYSDLHSQETELTGSGPCGRELPGRIAVSSRQRFFFLSFESACDTLGMTAHEGFGLFAGLEQSIVQQLVVRRMRLSVGMKERRV